MDRAAFQYLCAVEEARQWIAFVLALESLPAATEISEALRNGVVLAKLAKFFDPSASTQQARIYDENEEIYKTKGLNYRHTDNINLWISAMRNIGLPEVFIPETIDIYEKRNVPKVIYSVHALSYYLEKTGVAPGIRAISQKDAASKFTDQDMNAVQSEIDAAAGPLPKFDQLAGRVKEELSPTAAVTVDRRKAVVEELRRSEANYLAMMTKAQEVFETPMKESLKTKNPLTTERAIADMFDRLHPIAKVSQELLPQLTDEGASRAFLFLASVIREQYAAYATHYENALLAIKKQRDIRKEFNTFLDGKDDRLEFLLMAPLQRVPQYLVSLVNLLGLTDTAHPDYQQLKEAVATIRKVVDDIIERVKMWQNEQKIEDIRRRMWAGSVKSMNVPEIRKHGRMLFSEGDILKRDRKNLTEYSKRHMFVFDDMLLYVKVLEDKYTDTVLSHARTATKSVGDFGKEKLPTKVSSMSAQLKDAVKRTVGEYVYTANPNLTAYMYKHIFPLQEISIVEDKKDPLEFHIVHQGTTYTFKCGSPDERGMWVGDVKMHKANLSASSTAAPTLAPSRPPPPSRAPAGARPAAPQQ